MNLKNVDAFFFNEIAFFTYIDSLGDFA